MDEGNRGEYSDLRSGPHYGTENTRLSVSCGKQGLQKVLLSQAWRTDSPDHPYSELPLRLLPVCPIRPTRGTEFQVTGSSGEGQPSLGNQVKEEAQGAEQLQQGAKRPRDTENDN